jgi:hypothetical protein
MWVGKKLAKCRDSRRLTRGKSAIEARKARVPPADRPRNVLPDRKCSPGLASWQDSGGPRGTPDRGLTATRRGSPGLAPIHGPRRMAILTLGAPTAHPPVGTVRSPPSRPRVRSLFGVSQLGAYVLGESGWGDVARADWQTALVTSVVNTDARNDRMLDASGELFLMRKLTDLGLLLLPCLFRRL